MKLPERKEGNNLMDAKKYAKEMGIDLSNPNPTQSAQTKDAINEAATKALAVAEKTIQDQRETILAMQEELASLREANTRITAENDTLKANYDKLSDDMIETVGELKTKIEEHQKAYDELLVKAKALQEENKKLKAEAKKGDDSK